MTPLGRFTAFNSYYCILSLAKVLLNMGIFLAFNSYYCIPHVTVSDINYIFFIFQFLLLYSPHPVLTVATTARVAFNSYYCILLLASELHQAHGDPSLSILIIVFRPRAPPRNAKRHIHFQFLLLYSKRDLLPKFLNIVFDTYLVR